MGRGVEGVADVACVIERHRRNSCNGGATVPGGIQALAGSVRAGRAG